jgi:hypothetical protein
MSRGVKSEAQVLREVLLAVGGRPDCLAIRRNIGKARDPLTGQVVTFGLEGEGDVEVLLAGGRYLYLECKSPTGRLRPAQERFAARVAELGGAYRVVRSADEAVAAVEETLCR